MAVYERTICLSCEDTAEVDRIMHRKTVSERDCDYDKSFTAEFEGDIIGCVASLVREDIRSREARDTEQKLIRTAASFLGKQLEE